MRLIPLGDVQCIWTNAGLVEYKLCDKSYECEKCLFYDEVRKRPLEIDFSVDSNNDISRFESSLFTFMENYTLKENYYYSKHHTWIQKIFGDRIKVGVDPFASSLFPKNASAVLSTQGNYFEQGKPFFWLINAETVISIKAPVSGKIKENNIKLLNSSGLIKKSPYDEGWLYIIEPTNLKKELRKLYKNTQMESVCRNDSKKVRKRFEESVKSFEKHIRPAMIDGANPIGNLEDILGLKRYSKIIESIF